ncbi:MAG: hypothetical protein EBV03_03240 [Proteobacteria bacterium]|nr:hypothetical protein [Pseudomonadota bacterium]
MRLLKGNSWIYAGLTSAALLLLPVWLAYVYGGPRTLFNLLAADSMYYLGVAHRFAQDGFANFDGETITNGFHPLWLYLLTVIFKLTGWNTHQGVYLLVVLSGLLVWAAYMLFGVVLMRAWGIAAGWLSMLLLFPGFYSLCVEPHRHQNSDPGVLYTLTPQGMLNGMETPLCLFFLALFIISMQRGYAAKGRIPSLACWSLAGLLMSRLDEIFLLVSLWLSMQLLSPATRREKFFEALRAFWPSAILLSLYFACNMLTVGVLLPHSATAKYKLGEAFYTNMSYLRTATPNGWDVTFLRATPQYFCIFTGIFLLCGVAGRVHRQGLPAPHSAPQLLYLLLSACGLQLVLRSGFYLSSVWLFLQGTWYYSTMIISVNLVFAYGIGWLITVHPEFRNVLLACLFLVVPVRSFNGYHNITYIGSSYETLDCEQTTEMVMDNYADAAFVLWCHGSKIKAYFESKAPGEKLIDTWDGMFGALIGLPAQTVTGLMRSTQDIQQIQKYGQWETFTRRHFTLWPQYGYPTPTEDDVKVECYERLSIPQVPISFCHMRFKPEYRQLDKPLP